MNMIECYEDVTDYFKEHKRSGAIIRVKTEKELKKYQKFFKAQIEKDNNLDDSVYENIEWRVDPTILDK